ncbi:EndoS/ChiA family endoglycosidase [Flexivirga meconopsidis]|uniref:EndoS/ChiA family endoglycosidase n=1 Tax=Flexivirga meconopsidis TaxID=2977121 RepID=UPI00223FB994|nr:hypothetical protein [Flexivirga meconopsidis]
MTNLTRRARAVGAVVGAAALIGTAAIGSSAAATAPDRATSPRAVPGNAAQCSSTPLTAGYYRMWRDIRTTKPEDRAPNVQSMDEIPPSVNIVSAFATKPTEDPDFWAALKSTYVPKLHAQGTKVIFTLFVDDLADANVAMTDAAYDAFARQLVDSYVTSAGLDGLDIDVEQALSGTRLAKAAGIMKALGKYLGPSSGTGKYLVYDTNMDGTHPLLQASAPYLSYVWVQSYGRSVSWLQGTWDSFAPYIQPCQYFIGFTFYEERGFNWYDAVNPLSSSRAASYATWQPSGTRKGGLFAYALDRDGKQPGDDTISKTDYSWITQLAAKQAG